jgi:hypothetical protein
MNYYKIQYYENVIQCSPLYTIFNYKMIMTNVLHLYFVYTVDIDSSEFRLMPMRKNAWGGGGGGGKANRPIFKPN